MRLEMRFSSSFCLFCLFYLFFFLCSFVRSFLYCLFVSSLLFLFPLFPLPFHSPFPKPFSVVNPYLVLMSSIHFEVFLTALSCRISPWLILPSFVFLLSPFLPFPQKFVFSSHFDCSFLFEVFSSFVFFPLFCLSLVLCAPSTLLAVF